jgi:hypothetical protein
MEITLWAYEVTAPPDEFLFFAETEAACKLAAIEQRQELMRLEPDDYDIPPMPLYQITFREMTASELVAVLNCDTTLIEACTVERKLIGLVVD